MLVGLGECARDLTKCVPWVPEDIFFLSILMVRGVNEAPSAEEKELSISTGLFRLRYFDNSARICSACRIALTSLKYKQSAERLG